MSTPKNSPNGLTPPTSGRHGPDSIPLGPSGPSASNPPPPGAGSAKLTTTEYEEGWPNEDPTREAEYAMQCPGCGEMYADYDGFGVLHCESCGYCKHASYSEGKCDYCGEPELEPVTVKNHVDEVKKITYDGQQSQFQIITDLANQMYLQGLEHGTSRVIAFFTGGLDEDNPTLKAAIAHFEGGQNA